MQYEIDKLLHSVNDIHIKRILYLIRKYNKFAVRYMFKYNTNRSFSYRYHKLQKTKIWHNARRYLLDFFLHNNNNSLSCEVCGLSINIMILVIIDFTIKNIKLTSYLHQVLFVLFIRNVIKNFIKRRSD